jgi:hypothetical protein
VLSFRLDGRRLEVALEEPVPAPIGILAMGRRMNALIAVEHPAPAMTLELSRDMAGALEPLLGVRAVPPGFPLSAGTPRAALEPLPPDPPSFPGR